MWWKEYIQPNYIVVVYRHLLQHVLGTKWYIKAVDPKNKKKNKGVGESFWSFMISGMMVGFVHVCYELTFQQPIFNLI